MNKIENASAGFLALILLTVPVQADVTWPRMVESADGTLISYEVHGGGDPTLVFVHGWSCDGRYWRAQVPHFSSDHRVVVVDLAGHGQSGLGRSNYTMEAFGEDVKAVVEDLGAEQVILIGHSMGGPASVAAARLMPERVVGIVGVDTFHDVGERMTQDEADEWLTPLKADFRSGASQFVPQMFRENTDAALRDWVIADMSAAPPQVAVSAMEEMLADVISGEALAAFEGLEMPIVAINGDLFPTEIEANREHIHSFDAVIMEGTDHFLHMALPDAFNQALEAVIAVML
jgi:pimeloyl-ACP methyl ester carboxylesterase